MRVTSLGDDEPSEGKDDSRKRPGRDATAPIDREQGRGTRRPGHHWSHDDYLRLQDALQEFVNGSMKFDIDHVYGRIPGTRCVPHTPFFFSFLTVLAIPKRALKTNADASPQCLQKGCSWFGWSFFARFVRFAVGFGGSSHWEGMNPSNHSLRVSSFFTFASVPESVGKGCGKGFETR